MNKKIAPLFVLNILMVSASEVLVHDDNSDSSWDDTEPVSQVRQGSSDMIEEMARRRREMFLDEISEASSQFSTEPQEFFSSVVLMPGVPVLQNPENSSEPEPFPKIIGGLTYDQLPPEPINSQKIRPNLPPKSQVITEPQPAEGASSSQSQYAPLPPEAFRAHTNSMLHSAAKKGDSKLCADLLAQGLNIETPNEKGETPLIIACSYGHTEVCSLLLNHNASPNATDTRGWAAIHHAANNHNDVSLVQALLNKGTDINLVTRSRGDTPLHMAAKRGNDQVCAYLMNAHARLDIRNLDNKTAFECAFDNEDLSVARIISRGSLSEVIRLTIRRARPAMLKKLLSMSKDLKKDLVFPDGSTALHIACALSVEDDIDLTQGLVLGHRKVAVRAVDSELGSKQREMINLLLDTGVLTVDRVDSHGRTALHVATEWAQQVACMTLLERGASLSKTVSHRHQSDKTFTAFSLASLYNNEALMIDFCEYCITHKKEVEFTRQYPLLIALASHNSCAEVVKRLLIYAKRLSLSLAQMKNSYPLHRACLEGNEDICKYLLNEGANPEELFDKSTYDSKAFGTFWTDADGKNITPLHCAAFAGHLEICRILLRKRVPINPLTSQGRSPLYYACLANKEAVVSFLLIRGSRINAEDLEASNVELCELLLENLKRRYERLPVDERGVREEEESIVGLLRAVDQNRQTLLHREAQKGNWEKCACILDRFAPLSAVDSRGRTALHLACQIGNDGKNLLLEKYGETVKVLVGDPDTDPSFINIQDTNGETALHYACKGGADSLNVVRMLLEAGADPDLASYGMFFGKTPRTVALESKSDELIELIKGYPKQ